MGVLSQFRTWQGRHPKKPLSRTKLDSLRLCRWLVNSLAPWSGLTVLAWKRGGYGMPPLTVSVRESFGMFGHFVNGAAMTALSYHTDPSKD